MNLKVTLFSTIVLILGALASPHLHAETASPLSLRERGSLALTVNKTRWRCTDFSQNAVIELDWPQARDTGPAAELARILLARENLTSLFFTTAPSGSCAALNAWVQNQAQELSAHLVLERRQYAGQDCPVSSDEEDVCRYFLGEEVGYQLQLGEGAIAPLWPNLGRGVAIVDDHLLWSVKRWKEVGGSQASPVTLPSELKPAYFQLLEERLHVLEESRRLDQNLYQPGAEAAAFFSDFVGELALIEHLYNDGSALISFPGIIHAKEHRPLIEIGIVTEVLNRFHSGVRVRLLSSASSTRPYATVQRVFSNGLLEVRYDGGGNFMYVHMSLFELIDP